MNKTILAFGDSLTWGFVPNAFDRHPFDVRWPNVLTAGLGQGFRVIEEGTNGRTTAYDDLTDGSELNGARALPMVLETHQPLDLVIVMLGTNDLKFAGRCRAFDAELGMGRLIEIVQKFPYMPTYQVPKILIMAPPAICKTRDPWFSDLWEHAIAESKKLPQHYARLAKAMGVQFYDTNKVAKTDPIDGGHLDVASTRAIGKALVPVVRKILGE
ncbi:MAG: SGNH/GDSL hydrolase family protein [Rhizobiales bacterium]|nr:SGNH/GDSL hydrolase family protein [Hyphomicrobiales bacterium]MBI3674643.1 SGNH/GDSL hydrolase family protein [Hyphomicrobiales bacterium]